jgi:hypothetical protein
MAGQDGCRKVGAMDRRDSPKENKFDNLCTGDNKEVVQ